eukprot:TCONS_00018329-protein
MTRIQAKSCQFFLLLSGCTVLAFVLKLKNGFIDQFVEAREQNRREFISIKTDLQKIKIRLHQIGKTLLVVKNDTNVLKMKKKKNEKLIDNSNNYKEEVNLKTEIFNKKHHLIQRIEFKKLLDMINNIEKQQTVMVSLLKARDKDISKHLRQLEAEKTKHGSLPHKGDTLESIQFKEQSRILMN